VSKSHEKTANVEAVTDEALAAMASERAAPPPAPVLPGPLANLAAKLPAWGWILLFGLVLIVPRLGSYGFWDPWELGGAERAREMAVKGTFFDPTVGDPKAWPAVPPLGPALQALGIKIIGTSELGARLPIALCGVGALLAIYWAGLGLFRKRTAVLAALAAGSMSMFVLEARQIVSDMPLIAALALTVGGMGRFAWPPDGKRRWSHVGVAAGALVIAFLAGGALFGVALPLLALLATAVVGYGLAPAAVVEPPLSAPGLGPDAPEGQPIGKSLLRPGGRAFAVMAVAGLGALGLLIAAMVGHVAGQYSVLLGGTPKSGAPDKMFEALIEQLGFGLFPWGALAVFALGRGLLRVDDESAARSGRLVFGQLYLLFFAAFGYALSAYFVIMTGEGRYVALAPIALAIGALLDELLEGQRDEGVLGIVVAIGTVLVGRDLFQDPADIASMHINGKVTWPPGVNVGRPILILAALFSVAFYGGTAARARATGAEPGPDLSGARLWRRLVDRVWLGVGRWGLQATVVVALVWGLAFSHGLIPVLSRHYSFKNVLGTFNKYAESGAELAKYRVVAKGSSFYAKNMQDLPSQQAAVDFLKKPARVFLLVNAEDLPALHAAFKAAQVDYKVVDASSSRFLLVSNQLGPGEQDHNPLSTNVRTEPFGEPRVKVHAMFDDKIELLGCDYPESIGRPSKIPFKIYLKVLGRPTSSQKIFMHFDSPGNPRLLGDHDVLNKAYPTSQWQPGEYLRDDYDVDVPLMTTPAGTYTIWIGFWPGGEGRRLKVTDGESDGSDRVKVGTIEIK